jgi:hypothetical protein
MHITVITDNNNSYTHASHSLQHIATQEGIKPRHRRHLGGWSGRYYLSECRRPPSAVNDQMTVYGKPTSIKEHQNESKWRSWNIQMIRNIQELQEVTRSELVVGEVGTAASEFLTTAPFAIHVAMQWISFESIAKCSLANEIVKSTNLKDHLLLSEGLSVEIIPLPHCFISPPHFFVSLPQTLLKHFNLKPVFQAARDEGTPWALRRRHNLMSSHLLIVDYAI